jgi:hypothetical protein
MHRLTPFMTALCLLSLFPPPARGQVVGEPATWDLTHSVYVEGLGNGGLVSLNYEIGLTDALGVRAGVGWLVFWITYPITASYSIGNSNHKLELGGGITLVTFPDSDGDSPNFFDEIIRQPGRRPAVLGGLIGGYRFVSDGGFLFRLSFTPLFTSESFQPFAGVSLGYQF